MLVYFQFCPVLLQPPNTPSHISTLLSLNNSCNLKVLPLLHMDQSSRVRMPPPSNSNSPSNTSQDAQTRALAMAAPEPPVSSLPVEDPHGTVDQLGLVQTQLQFVASPTLVTEIAVLIAQMQSSEAHPDFVLSFSVGSGSFRQTADLRDEAWHGHVLHHHFDNHRSHLTSGEPDRPPMEQQQPLELSPTQMQSVTGDCCNDTRNQPRHLANHKSAGTSIHMYAARCAPAWADTAATTVSISVRHLEPNSCSLLFSGGKRWRKCARVSKTPTIQLQKI